MSQIRRRVAVAAAAALALGLSVGSAGPAGAAPTDPPSYVKSWLALDTGASNTVRLVNADKTLSGSPQVLSGGKACSLNEGGAAQPGGPPPPPVPRCSPATTLRTPVRTAAPTTTVGGRSAHRRGPESPS